MADTETPEPDVVDGVPYCRDACRHHDGKRCRLMGLRPSSICEPAVQEIAGELAAARPVLAAVDALDADWLDKCKFSRDVRLFTFAEAALARRAGKKGSNHG